MHTQDSWTFDDFDTELKNLSPEVREKAIEIAIKLMQEQDYIKKTAIVEGIKKAEEWFFNMEG